MWNPKLESELFMLLHYNPLAYCKLWMDLLPMHDFYHHELFVCKTLVVDSTNLPNFVTFHYTISKKSHLFIAPLVSSEVCKIWSCQAYSDGYELSNIWIFPWKLKFYRWQQMLWVVFLEVTSSRHLFLRKCPPDTQIWIIILSSLFIQVGITCYEKSG